MGHYLLIGAGFSRNWGGPLSDEITGSLLGDLHDDSQIVAALRRGPFEDAFQGFSTPTQIGFEAARILRFQTAVTDLFDRLNKTFLTKHFEFQNDIDWSVTRFLAKFDAIFSLNQDLLLEIHYIQTFIAHGKFNGVVMPGMSPLTPTSHTGPVDTTMMRWRPTTNIIGGPGFQPLYKLHGSSNWYTETGDRLLIMGNGKTALSGGFRSLKTTRVNSRLAFSKEARN